MTELRTGERQIIAFRREQQIRPDTFYLLKGPPCLHCGLVREDEESMEELMPDCGAFLRTALKQTCYCARFPVNCTDSARN